MSAPQRVLVLSASMGAGHDGAARELVRRLQDQGHHAEARDFLDSGPLHIGGALRSGYEFELKHVPSAYDLTYRLWYRVPWLCPLVAWLVTALTGRRVLRWVRQISPDVVVSTYPLATLCLGRLRARGRLRVPAVNFITDFGVHPLWVHRGMDLNLAVHAGPADMAFRRTGRPAVACGPVVSAAFAPAAAGVAARAAARAELGLGPDEAAVLVVAGSWGVGGLEETYRSIAASGRFTPVVVCGRDGALRAQMSEAAASAGERAIVLGWTDRMPALMAACDALVENAGGLTSLEAFQAGLPVVSFRPIAGHGKENTAAMAAAGVSRLAATPDELVEALGAVTAPGLARRRQVAAGRAMFRGDAAGLVVETAELASAGVGAPADGVRSGRRPRVAVVRMAAATLAVVALVWTGLTSGVEVAAAAVGAGMAHPVSKAGRVVYAGVRLSDAELIDPAVARQLTALHASAVVDHWTALAAPDTVRNLAASGVDIEDGGRGGWFDTNGQPTEPMLWTRARGDAQAGRQLAALIGRPVTMFVPGRRVNAWDLVESGEANLSIVMADSVFRAADPADRADPVSLTAHNIYLLNGLGATPSQLSALLDRMSRRLAAEHLGAAPLSALT